MDARNIHANVLPFLGLFVLLTVLFVFAMLSQSLLISKQNVAAVSAAKVAALTNAERTEEGLQTLERNTLLDQAAQMKAQDMAAKGYYAHVSPEGLTPMHWVEKAGYRYLAIGENLVVNRTEAEQVVDAFMGSPGHRANILRKDFTEIGIGVANGVYKGKDAMFTVQIFATPYPQNNKPAVAKQTVKQTPPVSKPSVAPASVAVVNVPRTTVKSVVVSTSTVSEGASIQEKVTDLIAPIVSSIQSASTTTSTTPATVPLTTPSFVLADAAPIELVGVSQLEAQALPTPVGSTWTMEIKLFVDTTFKKIRGFFGT